MAYDEPPKVVAPSDRPLDLPPTGAAAELPPVLRLLVEAVLAVRADQFDAPLGELRVMRYELRVARTARVAGSADARCESPRYRRGGSEEMA